MVIIERRCIECNRNRPSDDKTWFCEQCRKNIIEYCTEQNRKLLNNR